jgi:hypothetical protein
VVTCFPRILPKRWSTINYELVRSYAERLVPHSSSVCKIQEVKNQQSFYTNDFRDVRFEGEKLEASRVPVHLRNVGSSNQSKAMKLFRHLAETSELPSGVYADFFQVS